MSDRLHLWLREETTPKEPRAALAPEDAATLIQSGHKVTVEHSLQRVFTSEEYRNAGATIVLPGTWKQAPNDAFILGMKDLPKNQFPLAHHHLYFGHVYKAQPGAKELLSRFQNGKGTLLDYEYLVGRDGKRLVGTGYWAGYVGALLGIWQWALAGRQRSLPLLTPFLDKQDLLDQIPLLKRKPTVLVIGHQGRSGKGACDAVTELGLDLVCWGREATQGDGPFPELLGYDILVNCIGVQEPGPAFLTLDAMSTSLRKLTVISDVTCDIGNPCNRLPLSPRTTSFERPVTRLVHWPTLDLIALDRLPALLPRECSLEFSAKLSPLLFDLVSMNEKQPWKRALEIFQEKVTLASANHMMPIDESKTQSAVFPSSFSLRKK